MGLAEANSIGAERSQREHGTDGVDLCFTGLQLAHVLLLLKAMSDSSSNIISKSEVNFC